MIYVIGNPTEPSAEYQQKCFYDFWRWTQDLDKVEFDIETNMTDWWCDKKIITVQFGWEHTQWVLQWSELTDGEKASVKVLLEDRETPKLIHNAMFECVVCLFHGIRIQNVIDTMLGEQVIYGGEQNTIQYGLDDVCLRRLGIKLDKSQQDKFGDNILTPEKIVYAAQDVRYLNFIYQQQLVDFAKTADDFNPHGLKKVADLENEAVLAFAEMVYHGMEIDQDWWRRLQDEAEPLVAEAHRKLTEWINQEPFYSKALELGYISKQDKCLINWQSPKQKAHIFSELIPEIPGASKAVVKKWWKENRVRLLVDKDTKTWIDYYIEGDHSHLEAELLQKHRQWLIDNQMLIPAGVCTINWNSVEQVLPIMRAVEPQMQNMSAESVGRTTHPIFSDYEEYKDSLKLISAFGEQFLQKYVEPDGKVRTRFNQIVTTGRVSSSSPNMQQIPVKENVGNKYVNAFVAPAGWKYVSSDFVSQELIFVAYLSKDPVWTEALAKGQDLHSVTAEMVFKNKWKDTAEKDCAYYQQIVDKTGTLTTAKQKCSCRKHKYMRTGVKTVNFGLIYGMSHFKLASTLRITVPEAKSLIEDYFRAFPNIKGLLDFLGTFGVKNGYIQTIYPFYRRRYFPHWRWYKQYIDEHLSGIRYNEMLGSIERQSKNQPVQGSSADTCKVALVKVYKHIHENRLEDRVYLAMQVHDRIDTIAREDFADEWQPVLNKLMEEGAKVLIPNGMLKADTQVTTRWSK